MKTRQITPQSKNGEEKSFEIGEEATRVYVIADILSKSYCNEFYPIDAGTEDVYLSGKNTLPVRGNPFRFDNQTDPEAIENRRKGKGKAVTVIVIAAIVGFVIGFLVVSLSL